MNAKLEHVLTLIVTLTAIFSLTACIPQGQKGTELTVINADSLMVPFQELAKAFEAEHPGVDVEIEGHGSIQVIRQVTELGTEADVLAVADCSLIPMMMYNLQIPGTSENYADWYMTFATNHMVIAYTSQSKYADQIDNTNWYKILSMPDVNVGIADPRLDSSGYRALMTCELAGLYYGNESIFQNVLGSFSPPITVSEGNGTYTIKVPEIIEPLKADVQGSEIALIATVESGDIDYAFMYQSVAEQQGLRFIQLPPEIDLSSDAYEKLTSGLSVEIEFQRFASVTPVFECQPISYGITIPKNAPHPDLAVDFIKFIFSDTGQKIFQDCKQPMIIPPSADEPSRLPSDLRLLVE
jgi:molybdate/tungstate transport system substrate-binding protein